MFDLYWFVERIILKKQRMENSINVWFVKTIILKNKTEYTTIFIPFQRGRMQQQKPSISLGKFMANPAKITKSRTGEQWQRALLFLQDTRHLGFAGTAIQRQNSSSFTTMLGAFNPAHFFSMCWGRVSLFEYVTFRSVNWRKLEP